MFKTLFLHEIQQYLYSLRFQVAFIIVLLVFIIGTVSFIVYIGEYQKNSIEAMNSGENSDNIPDNLKSIEELSKDVSALAVTRRDYVIKVRENNVIADCKENLLPNVFNYNAYNVFKFEVRHTNNNPLIKKSEGLSWAFIVSMFLSFITLLFAFDSISGEKEDRTLSLVFSNSVSRAGYLFSKFLSIITVVIGMAIFGIMISTLILIVSGKVIIDINFLLEALGFIVISILLIAAFAAFGLFSSVVTKHSNVSLLISLCFWLLSVVVIPNTSVFWANKLFPIPNADEVEAIIIAEKWDINRKAPDGSWSSNGGNKFYKRHELRANNQMNLMNCEKRHRDHFYLQMFRQFEKTRMITIVSPIAQYDYMNEAFLGGGYLRFQRNWQDLHIFQERFLTWFKDIDAKDPDSPHWYNPYETYSTSSKPVDPMTVPVYREQNSSFGERVSFISGYLIAMVVTIALFFIISFVLFIRYDVR